MFLPGESRGERSLAVTELDTTEQLTPAACPSGAAQASPPQISASPKGKAMILGGPPHKREDEDPWIEYKRASTWAIVIILENMKQKREICSLWREAMWVFYILFIRKIPWRRKWQPTQVFLPGKFHGQRSLAGSSVRHDWVISPSSCCVFYFFNTRSVIFLVCLIFFYL